MLHPTQQNITLPPQSPLPILIRPSRPRHRLAVPLSKLALLPPPLRLLLPLLRNLQLLRKRRSLRFPLLPTASSVAGVLVLRQRGSLGGCRRRLVHHRHSIGVGVERHGFCGLTILPITVVFTILRRCCVGGRPPRSFRFLGGFDFGVGFFDFYFLDEVGFDFLGCMGERDIISNVTIIRSVDWLGSR